MAVHNDTGKKGEEIAAEYFLSKGYEILHRNWRHKHLEVDIVANRNGILHFIEVKTRTSLAFGFPEENVTATKMNRLINASAEFLYQYPQWQRIQFDVLSININSRSNETAFLLIEDVYL